MAQPVRRPRGRRRQTIEGSRARKRHPEKASRRGRVGESGVERGRQGKLLTPECRRAAVAHLMSVLEVSERFACRVTGQHRSTQRHPPASQTPTDPDSALRDWLRTWARNHPRQGFRRAYHDARAEGWTVNHKKIQRLWRAEGLRVPTRRRRKRIGTSTATAVTAQAPNRVWAVDFQFDATDDGRPVKIVSIIPRWATRFRPDSLPSASTDNRLSRSVDRSTGSRQLDEIEASSEVDRRNGNIYSWEFQELLGPSIPTTCAARMHAELDAIRECGRHQRGTATGPQPVDVRQLLYSIVDVELSETLRGLVVPYKRATYDSVSGAWLSGQIRLAPRDRYQTNFPGTLSRNGLPCRARGTFVGNSPTIPAQSMRFPRGCANIVVDSDDHGA